jgi:hypothetical protein
MTRILVCGVADEDPIFVHNKLCEVNRIYGPVTCVIHNNHVQALAWQQWVSRRQPQTRHLPVNEDCVHDGVAAGERCRNRMFAARPDYVVMFRANDSDDGGVAKKTSHIVSRAERAGIPVLVYDLYPRRHIRAATIARDDLDTRLTVDEFVAEKKRGRKSSQPIQYAA